MTTHLVLYLETSNVIEHKVFDRASQRPVNSATVTASLFDSDGNEVGGAEWPATLVYQPGSRGVYRYYTPPGLLLVDGAKYRLEIIADDTVGHLSTVQKSVVAKVQRC